MPAIPSSEPSLIVAGDTVQWTKTLTDYSAVDWTLSYSFQIPGSTSQPITFDADADGANYSITVDSSDTADWPPANYVWTSYVTNISDERHTISQSTVTISPDPAAAYGATHATRTLAIIEAALENRLPRGLEMYTIDGQQVQKLTHEALSRLRDKYKAEVKAENDAARVAAGLPSKRTMWASFRRPL